jgi:hypothetical protein
VPGICNRIGKLAGVERTAPGGPAAGCGPRLTWTAAGTNWQCLWVNAEKA